MFTYERCRFFGSQTAKEYFRDHLITSSAFLMENIGDCYDIDQEKHVVMKQ